jgi:hypothetical protein
MRITRQILPVLLLVLGLYSLAGCGGGTASSLGHSMNQPGSSIDGVTSGSFKAVRYNDHGYQDSSLNPTLSLTTTNSGDTTTVTIAVSDKTPMIGAAIDLYYDPAQFNPVKTDFSGLVSTPLQLATTKVTGIVSLGQADTNGQAVRSGQFATVTFAHGAARTVSAASDAHTTPINSVYPKTPPTGVTISLNGFNVTSANADNSNPATYEISSVFATGDGDMNGSSNIADLTAMAFNGYYGKTITNSTDLGCAATDYDGNGQTNIADLTALGQHVGQATTGIDVLIADNDHTFDGSETVLHHFAWADGTAPTRPPSSSLASLKDAFVLWSGTVSAADINTADTNGDHIVRLSAVATGAGAPGPAFTDANVTVQTNGVPPPPAGVKVTGYDVQIQHTGADIDFSGAGGDASLVAGDPAVVLNVTGVSGTYNDGTNGDKAFTASTGQSGAGGEISASQYAATLTSIQGQVTWDVTTQGDNATNEFHTATPVIALSGTSGTGVTGTVTVDDDPDSTLATTPEGRLRANLASTGVGTAIPVDVTYDFRIDVTQDAAAPTFHSISSAAPAVGNYLGINAVGSTSIDAEVNLGTAALPTDRTQMVCKLVDLTDPTGDITLSYLASGNLNDGQYRLDENFTPMVLNIQISGQAVPGHLYGIHLILPNAGSANGSDVAVTSVNYPDSSGIAGTLTNEKFFEVGPPPAPVTFSTLPGKNEVVPATDVIDIMYPDPVMRRDPRVLFSGFTATYSDVDGYNDVIKQSGNEFAPTKIAVNGQGPVTFPQVITIQGTDASTITSTTQSEPANVVSVSPSGVILDIAPITTSGGLNSVDYAFKVFTGAADPANWISLGTGSFTFNPVGIANSGFTGVDFGVNAFSSVNRGDLDLANPVWTLKDISGDNVKTAQPDVLFVEFAGYNFSDWNMAEPFDTGVVGDPSGFNTLNTHLRLTDDLSSTSMDCPLWPRAVDNNGNVIATFCPLKEYWSNAGTPGWSGIITPGEVYIVTLVDPQNSNNNFDFTSKLEASGNLPNP